MLHKNYLQHKKNFRLVKSQRDETGLFVLQFKSNGKFRYLEKCGLYAEKQSFLNRKFVYEIFLKIFLQKNLQFSKRKKSSKKT